MGSRQEFEALRDSPEELLDNENDRLIRQFLRGAAEGPITQRKENSDYEEDLLMVSLRQGKTK